MFYNLIGRFLVQNVEGILGTLSKTVERLEKAVEAHAKLAAHHDAKAQKHEYLAMDAQLNSGRAERAAAKIRKLID